MHFSFEHLFDYVLETETDTEMMRKKTIETGTEMIWKKTK